MPHTRALPSVLRDLGGQVRTVNLGVVYHDFSVDFGSADYGSEIGIVATTTMSPFALTEKYADYRSDGFFTDTSKLWLMAAATF